MLSVEQIVAKYGKPATESNLTYITSPYPLILPWDPAHTVQKIRCHKLIALNLLAVHTDLLAHYGLAEVNRLGINLFGGCYVPRPKRGNEEDYEKALKAGNTMLAYKYLSRHSWGIAEDRDPARNAWKTKAPAAQFSNPEYKPMIDIYYKNGFIGYGPEKNFDWMHFEINS